MPDGNRYFSPEYLFFPVFLFCSIIENIKLNFCGLSMLSSIKYTCENSKYKQIFRACGGIYDHCYYAEPTNHSFFLYYKNHYLAQHSLLLGNKYGYNAFAKILLRRGFVYLCCVSSPSCVTSRKIRNSARL